MNDTKLRIALVGLGTWARTGHLPLYRTPRFQSLVELAAVCSRSEDKARNWASEFNVQNAYGSYDQLLEKESLDAVVVCTADHAHFDYIMGALEAGLHVLVEKPMVTRRDQCRIIEDKSRAVNKKVITLYHKRADPLWAEAARRIRGGEFGAFQMGWASIQNPILVPNSGYFMSDLAAHSNSNWFLGTHFYDLLRYLIGQNPSEVKAYRYLVPEECEAGSNIDAIKADFVFEMGGAISVFISWNLSRHYPSLTKQDMRLHFEKGEIDLDGTRRGFTQDAHDGYRYVNPYFMRPSNIGFSGYAADFLEAAILSILKPDQETLVDLPSFIDSCWATTMACAVQESWQTNEIQKIIPPDENFR